MILKNKTNATQSVVLSDGTQVVARPYRTIDVKETPKNLDKAVWETSLPKTTTKGND